MSLPRPRSGNRAVPCKIWSKAQFPTPQPQAQRRASRRVSSCRSRTPQQGSAVPNRRTLRQPPPQPSPNVDRKTQNPIRIKCLNFQASQTQQLRETGVTEIFWEPSTSGAHLSEWACPEGRVAAGDVTRGPLFHWPISSFTQGRADYLPHKLATNRDGRIRRKEPLQGVSGGGASLQPKSWQPAGWPSTQSIIQNC
jgi:hypothetical protein